ncbi:MAG: hypothetical protein LC687_07305, partial [Actinobacteria bacterium]|nr:hypothetical protein [Actinomycetota bacterium]
AYRQQRLEVEHERLRRRLAWAMAKHDRKGAAWLEERLAELEDEIDADLSPGREIGRIEAPRLVR